MMAGQLHIHNELTCLPIHPHDARIEQTKKGYQLLLSYRDRAILNPYKILYVVIPAGQPTQPSIQHTHTHVAGISGKETKPKELFTLPIPFYSIFTSIHSFFGFAGDISGDGPGRNHSRSANLRPSSIKMTGSDIKMTAFHSSQFNGMIENNDYVCKSAKTIHAGEGNKQT